MTQALPHVIPDSVVRTLPRRPERWVRRFIGIVGLLDVLAVVVPLVLASIFFDDDRIANGRVLIFGALPVWMLILASLRVYDESLLGFGTEEFRRIGKAGLNLLAATAVVGFGFRLTLPRSLVAIVIPGAVILAIAFRLVARQQLHRLRAAGRCQHGVVVVGRPASAIPLVVRLQEMPERAFRIAQVCAAESVTIDEVLQAVRDGNADTVAIAADSGLSSEQLRRLGWELEGSRVDLMVSTDLVEVAGPRIHVRPMSGMPLLHVEQPEFTGVNRFVKGTYDRVVALLALILLSPLLVVVAIAIRFTSKGPAVFRQVRVGQHGGRFTVLKFRTMRQGAQAELESLAALNEADGPLFKMRDDPRVTRLGKVMRRYSIDELPQLFNVATGRMSLVGPRPPLPSEVELYGYDVGRRLLVKPGLTGLWQVSGRSDLGWDQSVRLDLHYVENWSPTLDLLILIKTAKAVLQRDGAY